VRLLAWVSLAAAGAADALGLELPGLVASALLVLPVPVALMAIATTFSSAWRGPRIVEFSPDEATLCTGEDSEPVRAYAQLRGTMGGAGHVFPGRVALPALAWVAVLVAGVQLLAGDGRGLAGPWPVVLAIAFALGAWMFPSRPYWYREVSGGGALVWPPEALGALLARESAEDARGVAAVHATGLADPLLRAAAPAAPARPSKETRRSPRFELDRTLVVSQGARRFEVALVNVSEEGLAVRWPSEIPVSGDDVVVELVQAGEEGGPRALVAEVRWERERPEQGRAVGLELRGDPKAEEAWREVVKGAVRARLIA
jgi:hypothetical protein